MDQNVVHWKAGYPRIWRTPEEAIDADSILKKLYACEQEWGTQDVRMDIYLFIPSMMSNELETNASRTVVTLLAHNQKNFVLHHIPRIHNWITADKSG